MKMQFAIELVGKKLLLDSEKLSALFALVDGCATMDQRFVGGKQGSCGYNNDYIPIIGTFNANEELRPNVYTDEQIEAIRFIQSQQEK